ncbi:hypothetical protein NM208_g3174 [Fusarium decemcellulare]|uniref:Uncharacterized protein n=1 Tax=Fusarium decemcellulare TaxID=57161 RepID=A0ACC1SQ65_9HYPO|nr:hypothetical protein NM208_g3174 [Fusarium decemcellulare]
MKPTLNYRAPNDTPQFKGQIYGIDTSEGTIFVLPAHFIEELKSNPALSFAASFDTLTHADWTPVKIYDVLFHLVCKSAAKTLLGEQAAQNARWLQIEADYITTAISYIQELKTWPKLLRPLIYRRVEGYSTLQKLSTEAQAIINDYLAQKKANDWKPLQDPPSFFDHVTAKYNNLSAEEHLSMQITLFIAGVHTSAASSTQAMFDAAVNPDCIKEVRNEVKELHEKCGGDLARQDLGQLVKLDSFIKEVLRFSSPDLATFVRKSSREVVLSNGFRIPKGAKLEVATGAIGMDSDVYDNPQAFDGLRFWKMRQLKDKAVKHQFTSISISDLDWGYGRHACPGRYMADITIKLLLIEILLHYEFKNPEGQNRYQSLNFDGQTMPDTDGEILIRRIKT